MKKRVQIQNIKPNQIIDLQQTKYLKGGEEEDIIIDDTTTL